MSPLAIAQLIAQLLPYGIEFTQGIIAAIHKPNPTLADWQTALSKARTPFDQGLEPGALIPTPPAVP